MKSVPHLSTAVSRRLAAIFSRTSAAEPRLPFRRLLIPLLLVALTLASIYYIAARPRRYAVFAAYSADGEVRPYTLRYLKKLKGVTNGIVYITDSSLSPKARKQIAPYIVHGEYQRHGEYDWGSYKRGFNWLKKNNYLKHADELIFANDSVYAPLTSFRPMFAKMHKRQDLDFWGNTQNQYLNQHLQSYFLVFRRPVIRSKSFAHFLNGVKHQPHHSLYITEYEIKLTPFLQNMGYNWDSYIPANLFPESKELLLADPNGYPLTAIGKYHSQFLKRRTFGEKLPVMEGRGELMKYLRRHAPETYENIIADFPAAAHYETDAPKKP